MRPIDGDALAKKLRDAINVGMSVNTSGLAELNAVLSDVETMPTIEPERKTGKWLYDEERCATGIYAICSACDESIYQTGNFQYCPNCGARMEGKNETD